MLTIHNKYVKIPVKHTLYLPKHEQMQIVSLRGRRRFFVAAAAADALDELPGLCIAEGVEDEEAYGQGNVEHRCHRVQTQVNLGHCQRA